MYFRGGRWDPSGKGTCYFQLEHASVLTPPRLYPPSDDAVATCFIKRKAVVMCNTESKNQYFHTGSFASSSAASNEIRTCVCPDGQTYTFGGADETTCTGGKITIGSTAHSGRKSCVLCEQELQRCQNDEACKKFLQHYGSDPTKTEAVASDNNLFIALHKCKEVGACGVTCGRSTLVTTSITNVAIRSGEVPSLVVETKNAAAAVNSVAYYDSVARYGGAEIQTVQVKDRTLFKAVCTGNRDWHAENKAAGAAFDAVCLDTDAVVTESITAKPWCVDATHQSDPTGCLESYASRERARLKMHACDQDYLTRTFKEAGGWVGRGAWSSTSGVEACYANCSQLAGYAPCSTTVTQPGVSTSTSVSEGSDQQLGCMQACEIRNIGIDPYSCTTHCRRGGYSGCNLSLKPPDADRDTNGHTLQFNLCTECASPPNEPALERVNECTHGCNQLLPFMIRAGGSGTSAYQVPRGIESVAPREGLTSGGTAVSIYGSRLFGGGTEIVYVTLAGVPATITSFSSEWLSVESGAADASSSGIPGDVVVISSSGASASFAGGWTYTRTSYAQPPPSASSPSPPQSLPAGVIPSVTEWMFVEGGDTYFCTKFDKSWSMDSYFSRCSTSVGVDGRTASQACGQCNGFESRPGSGSSDSTEKEENEPFWTRWLLQQQSENEKAANMTDAQYSGPNGSSSGDISSSELPSDSAKSDGAKTATVVVPVVPGLPSDSAKSDGAKTPTVVVLVVLGVLILVGIAAWFVVKSKRDPEHGHGDDGATAENVGITVSNFKVNDHGQRSAQARPSQYRVDVGQNANLKANPVYSSHQFTTAERDEVVYEGDLEDLDAPGDGRQSEANPVYLSDDLSASNSNNANLSQDHGFDSVVAYRSGALLEEEPNYVTTAEQRASASSSSGGGGVPASSSEVLYGESDQVASASSPMYEAPDAPQYVAPTSNAETALYGEAGAVIVEYAVPDSSATAAAAKLVEEDLYGDNSG